MKQEDKQFWKILETQYWKVKFPYYVYLSYFDFINKQLNRFVTNCV